MWAKRDVATNLQVPKYFYEIGDEENASRIKVMARGQDMKESGHSLVEMSRNVASNVTNQYE
jgi:hypothetical protein